MLNEKVEDSVSCFQELRRWSDKMGRRLSLNRMHPEVGLINIEY